MFLRGFRTAGKILGVRYDPTSSAAWLDETRGNSTGKWRNPYNLHNDKDDNQMKTLSQAILLFLSFLAAPVILGIVAVTGAVVALWIVFFVAYECYFERG